MLVQHAVEVVLVFVLRLVVLDVGGPVSCLQLLLYYLRLLDWRGLYDLSWGLGLGDNGLDDLGVSEIVDNSLLLESLASYPLHFLSCDRCSNN